MRRWRLPFALFTAVLLLPSAVRAVDILPLDQIRPGMKGTGYTVFEGTTIAEFAVQIIGVLENIGPKQSMILARLEGGPLEKTGVIAGMSGSPVFIDGKLIGAVAYGFPFSKETIAGLTPIAEMIELTDAAVGLPRAASARFAPPLGAAGPAAPLDRNALMASLRRPLQSVTLQPGSLRAGSLPPQLAGVSLTPLSLPLVFSGFDPATFEWAREVFSGLGFTPVVGTGRGSLPAEPLPDLKPGAALGVSLIEGDMDLSVTGTITHIDQDRVYAFGHPFYNLGPTQFPMKKAYVYSIFPSLYQSWKISSAAAEPVGTMDQDRTTAIAGRLGKAPRMIPVNIKLTTSRGQERSFSFRMVEDELFTPVLAFVGVASVLQGNERAFGTSTIRLDARVGLSGGREVRLQDLFTEEQPAMQAATLVAAPLAYLMTNDFEKLSVEGLEVEVSSLETIQTATVQRAWLEREGPVRPGSTVPLKIALRTYRGESRTETIPVTIPESAPGGHYTLLVADAAALTSIEQREMRQAFVPKDLDQLLRAINSLRHNHHIYARLLRAEEGAIVGGEYLQSLPPSVLSVLGGSERGGQVVPIRTAAVWESEVPTDYAISGSRLLALTVER
jgi:hypothetical protein